MNKFHNFDETILRAYDIRGVYNENLTKKDAFYLGKSFASYLNKNGKNKISIGYDGRLSSPSLKESLIKGLKESGLEVYDIGTGPSPMLYFSIYHLNVDAGIMITGSHNPANYNGFKIALRDRPFFGDDILGLDKINREQDFIDSEGSVKNVDLIDEYVDRVLKNSLAKNPESKLKIAWDAGNGAAGEVMRLASLKIFTDNHLLYEKIDGNFPNHHPDPSNEQNLSDIKKLISKNNLDLGIAFDGDGDRIGVIDDEGIILYPDQLLILYARDVLKKYPNANIIADVKASQSLFDEIAKAGGNPIMHKTGHSFIKSKMQEIDAKLAGEMSGHIFFADDYYGYDDALYAAIRIIDILLKDGRKLSEIRKSLPKTYSTPEIRIESDDSKKFDIVKKLQSDLKAKNINFNDIDGVRVNSDNGWWLIRASNTQPILVARCEANSKKNLDKLVENLKNILSEYNLTF
ncbi:MAG: phosphomannomutase [Rickettsiales bacterium]|jgi:phosphomannomutase